MNRKSNEPSEQRRAGLRKKKLGIMRVEAWVKDLSDGSKKGYLILDSKVIALNEESDKS